jgi:hypothetical protein
MDDESNKLLRQILDSQKEQTELMRKHLLPLWTRVRFSLLALLLLMTFVAIGLGLTAWQMSKRTAPATATITSPPIPTAVFSTQPQLLTGSGTLQITDGGSVLTGSLKTDDKVIPTDNR